jgi:hypothetical protein
VLADFEAHLRSWAAGRQLQLQTRRLPVRLPFHDEAWLGEAAQECAGWLAAASDDTPPPLRAINSSQLRRPLWSCVDGRRLCAPWLPPFTFFGSASTSAQRE